MNKTNKKILVTISSLLLLCILFTSINLHRNNSNKDTLTIAWNSGEILLTNNKLLTFDNVVDKDIIQYKNIGSPTTRKVTVISINDILRQYDIIIDNTNVIEVHALDGFYASYQASEILDNDIYIILQEDNKPIDQNLGSFQVAASKDNDSTRWIHSIYKIEVK